MNNTEETSLEIIISYKIIPQILLQICLVKIENFGEKRIIFHNAFSLRMRFNCSHSKSGNLKLYKVNSKHIFK